MKSGRLQIGHTCLGPPKLNWPRATRSLNPSLVVGVHAHKRKVGNPWFKLIRNVERSTFKVETRRDFRDCFDLYEVTAFEITVE